MANSIFAWRNFVDDSATLTDILGRFEAAAPVTNLQLPQTGRLAISSNGGASIRCDFTGGLDSPAVGRPVHLIALLNHNIIGPINPGTFMIDVLSVDGNYQPAGFPAPQLFQASDGQFQSHLFWIVPEIGGSPDWSRDEVTSFTVGIGNICGRIDPYTGEVIQEPLKLGGLWAGPIWQPDRGIQHASFLSGVTEARRGATSIGGQFYPQPQRRRRTLQASFTTMDELDAFRTVDNGASVQQMASWCGTSRPLIVIPDSTDPGLIYTQSVYGYLDGDIDMQHVETSAKKRQYNVAFSMTEAA